MAASDKFNRRVLPFANVTVTGRPEPDINCLKFVCRVCKFLNADPSLTDLG